MLSIRLFSRNLAPYSIVPTQRLHVSMKLFNSSDSSDSDSDVDTKTEEKKAKQDRINEAKRRTNEKMTQKINFLLESMVKSTNSSKSVHVVQKAEKVKKDNLINSKTGKNEPFEEKLVDAAKSVATSLGGDVKQTESELLNKILPSNTNDPNEVTKDEKETQPSVNLSELLMGLKIDHSSDKYDERKIRRATEIRDGMRKLDQMTKQTSQQQTYKQTSQKQKWKQTSQEQEPYRHRSRVNYMPEEKLFDGKPFNIFKQIPQVNKVSESSTTIPELPTWKALEQRELSLAVIQPPSSYFEEMIDWTTRGRLWHFPINNEQGLEEEEKVHFSEHVFMERHLKDWCPKRGPIRHFMELVCVGLSKNPYMTVAEKTGHIMWFKDYFGEKEELLKELGALDKEIPATETKQIEK